MSFSHLEDAAFLPSLPWWGAPCLLEVFFSPKIEIPEWGDGGGCDPPYFVWGFFSRRVKNSIQNRISSRSWPTESREKREEQRLTDKTDKKVEIVPSGWAACP
jgi:hypothetical protein